MLAMLLVCIVAWLLVAPVRSVSDDNDFWALVLEGALISIFLGGIQGLLFSLIPKWSKWAWAAVAFPTAFLFFHIVAKQDGTLAAATDRGGVTALIIFAAISWTMTGLVWLFFKMKRRGAA
jgi:hypothetical protein